MIYKTFYGKHIDLSKLVAISQAYFIDRMGYGGWFVGFDMHFQLMDTPITFTRELKDDVEKVFQEDKFYLKLVNGELSKWPPEDEFEILAVTTLQEEIDEIVDVWKKINGE